MILKTGASDEDMIFQGNDGGAAITALTLDMSAAGAAAFNSTVTATGFIIGSANIEEAELELLDGLTAGTAIASKVVTTDANIDTSGQRNLTISGELDAATGDFSGAVDVAGATTTAAITASGVVTANAGVVVDNITIDGTQIDLSSGDLLLDVAGDITLDADGGDWRFKDDGTEIFKLTNSSSDVIFANVVSDKDIIFRGNDGGSNVDALQLDMSAAGQAVFGAGGVKLGGDLQMQANDVKFDDNAKLTTWHW